jgi:hypothetical protein
MMDFSCPRCGAIYHAEEFHTGKRIRCGRCDEIISIPSPDGSYKSSSHPLQTKNKWGSAAVSIFERWQHLGTGRIFSWKRVFSLAGLAIICIGILMIEYSPGVRDQERNKSQSSSEINTNRNSVSAGASRPEDTENAQANYSADDVEVVPDASKRTLGISPPRKSYSNPTEDILPTSEDARRSKIPVTTLPAKSLPTGSVCQLEDQDTSGLGELKATNGTQYDACVIVVDADARDRVRRVRDRYIKAGDSYILDRLEQGNYRVLFATGVGWDEGTEQFSRNASYFDFGKILSFNEYRESDQVHYGRHSITLNPVPNGNVRSKPLSATEFHALIGKK